MLTSAPKTIRKIFLLVVLAILFLLPLGHTYSQTTSDLEKEITEKSDQIVEKKTILKGIEKKIAEIRGSNNSLGKKISLMTAEIESLKANIAKVEEDMDKKIKEIEEKQKELEQVKKFLDDVSGDLYIQSRNRLPAFFLLGEGWNDILRGAFVKSSTISFLKEKIEKINGDFSSLSDAKALLDKEKEDLDAQKKDLDASYALLNEERRKLQAELSRQHSERGVLSAEITDLSKKVSQLQAALIAARSAGIVSSGGSTGTVLGTSISQAPSGYFGVFSIGAYTHRNGMSQWGARARADAGQNYRTLLNVYYPGATFVEGYKEPETIWVKGKGVDCNNKAKDYNIKISFQEYMNSIYEMPASWNIEALKAQAVAARTYALHKVRTQGFVIPNQSNQVYKNCQNATGWRNAVAQTRGQVLTKKGVVFATEYAAVHGAWGNHVGWDTVSGNGKNWFNDAWEKKSGVNWFYRSWYVNGSGTKGETCGHSPFLSQQEMLLLVNGYLIKNDIGLKRTPDKSRLLPSDFEKCPGRLDYPDPKAKPPRLPTGKIPYSLAEMQSLLSNPVRSISNVNVAFGNGTTNTVVFYTNRGIVTISGERFKDIYNQMAPGHMRIQQQSSHVFFNVEKR